MRIPRSACGTCGPKCLSGHLMDIRARRGQRIMPSRQLPSVRTGKSLASGSTIDCTLRVWDVASRAQTALLLELDPERLDGVNSVSFSPDGTLLASASDDGVIRMWNTRTLKRIGELETKSGGVTSIVFRRDGKMLASLNGGPARDRKTSGR